MTKKSRKVFCSRCSLDTNHEILFDDYVEEHSEHYPEYNAHSATGYQYTLFKCCGCLNIVMFKQLRSTEIFPEDYSGWGDSWYPPKAIRKPPDWIRKLEKSERDLHEEILISINSACYTVAAMGLRALFDMYIVKAIGDKGSFKKKLNEMVKLGFLSSKNIVLIEPVLELGHAASHRGHKPDADAVLFTLDVIENLLHQDVMAANVPKGVADVPPRN